MNVVFFMETFFSDFFTQQTDVEQLVQDNHSLKSQLAGKTRVWV
jgi:dTDP-4-dehydrorhamnose 3,5-epimerase-like enzyme